MSFNNNRFKTIRQIGKGGMATVYLAKHIELNKMVAVKVLNKESVSDAEYIKRFFREARITAELNHPNIVKIIESNFTGGDFYIVTEYIDGGDLSSIINTNEISLRKKIRIIADIVSALDYAHERGIVHRDIKPSNILLTKELLPKLCDFGIATVLWGQESRLTQTNQLVGTMDYIAPEQKENSKNVDFRADIYSIGVILYKIVTGKKPLGAFKRPREINRLISDELDEIIIKCLQPIITDRYKNTNNLYDELIKEIDITYNKKKDTFLVTVSASDDDLEKFINKLENGSVTEKITAKTGFLKILKPTHEEKLLEVFKYADGILKETIIIAFGKLRIRKVCNPLIELLNDSYYNKFAAEALGEIRCREAEGALLNLLIANKDYSHIALKPLGQLNSKRAVRIMEKYLKNKADWIRELALESIAMIDDNSVIGYIENSANRDKNSEIRAKAKNILRRRIK